MVDDNPVQTVNVACLHIKILEEQVHPPLPVQLQQLKFWYNSFLLSSCAVKVQCTHYWEKASPPAWSACWALRCIWSPQGCPWKTQLCWIHCEHQTEECQTQPDLQRALFLACHLKKPNPCLYVWLNVIYHSHTRRLLSSDVLTNRRFSSTKVMVLTAPRWRSYSCTTSPVLMSHWKRRRVELKSPQSRTANEINNNIAGKGTCAQWCTGKMKTQETTTLISLLATNKHTLLFKQFYI